MKVKVSKLKSLIREAVEEELEIVRLEAAIKAMVKEELAKEGLMDTLSGGVAKATNWAADKLAGKGPALFDALTLVAPHLGTRPNMMQLVANPKVSSAVEMLMKNRSNKDLQLAVGAFVSNKNVGKSFGKGMTQAEVLKRVDQLVADYQAAKGQ